MPCAQCGDGSGNENINPLDTCSNGFMSCGNPCTSATPNTAANESLPSQIENFTKQFFGDVIKTEVNGVVSWSLPCSLDVGLPSNARGATEPLACYFLRLFADGVMGTPGPAGAPGVNGVDGRNAYTILTRSFTQPTLNNPELQLHVVANPAIAAGMLIFVDTSGWYRVEGTAPDGTLFVTFLYPVVQPAAQIENGRLVVPAGAQGLSTPGAQGATGGKGPTGDRGAPGPQGAPGLPGLPAPVTGVTNNNGQYHTDVGTIWTNPSGGSPVWTEVDFTVSKPNFTLSAAGTYLFTATVALKANSSGVDVSVRLYNVDQAIPVDGTTVLNASTTTRILSITAIHTTLAPNEVVRLEAYGKSAKVLPDNTTMTYVQLS